MTRQDLIHFMAHHKLTEDTLADELGVAKESVRRWVAGQVQMLRRHELMFKGLAAEFTLQRESKHE